MSGEQFAELQELINSFARSGEALREAYTVLSERQGALMMVTGALVGCFRAYDPDFAPRMIAGLEKFAAERGDALTCEQRQFFDDFIAVVVVGTGEASPPQGVARH